MIKDTDWGKLDSRCRNNYDTPCIERVLLQIEAAWEGTSNRPGVRAADTMHWKKVIWKREIQ